MTRSLCREPDECKLMRARGTDGSDHTCAEATSAKNRDVHHGVPNLGQAQASAETKRRD
jgi:hypothetical protein